MNSYIKTRSFRSTYLRTDTRCTCTSCHSHRLFEKSQCQRQRRHWRHRQSNRCLQWCRSSRSLSKCSQNIRSKKKRSWFERRRYDGKSKIFKFFSKFRFFSQIPILIYSIFLIYQFFIFFSGLVDRSVGFWNCLSWCT